MSRRVVVTGMGLVSCYGTKVNKFYDCLLEGKSGVREVERIKTEIDRLPVQHGACTDFDPAAHLDAKQAKRYDRVITQALVASQQALASAGLDKETLAKLDKYMIGAIVGSGIGGMDTYVNGVTNYNAKGYKRVSAFFVPCIITNMAGGILSMEYEFMGPNYSISTACATSNNCIHAAASHILSGDADVMVAGGTESPMNEVCYAGFVACKALARANGRPYSEISRPFDQERSGFVMGDGAAVLILEELEHALARGAPILAELCGSAINADAYHLTDPRPDGQGVALCIEKAIQRAGIKPSDIQHVNAHATSTPAGDVAEIRALKKVFGNAVSEPLVTATKSLIGHALGAAGGFETIATIEAMNRSVVHPTINLENPEPELDPIRVATEATEIDIRYALSNSFGFGGHNACLVFGKYST